MFTIFFWIIIAIIAIISGIYIFLLTNSIRSKAHNQPEGKKVILGVLTAFLIGFSIFGWNTFSLFNSLNGIISNSSLVKPIDNSGTKDPKPSNSSTPASNDGNGYTNF